MFETRKINQYIVVMLAVLFAVGMAACGSSKKNTKTAQSTVTEKVTETYKPKQKNDTPDAVADALISEARTWIGVPYRYGGHSHDGADCSGFLMEVFKNAVNVDLPRTTNDQREHCVEVDRDHISVGDILFFSSNSSSEKIAHVGMYIGDGRMIHASTSRGVVEDNLDLNYYVKHFRSIGRVPELAKANPVPKVEKPLPVHIITEREEVLETKAEAKNDTVKTAEPTKIDAATIVKNAFGSKKAQ